MTETDKSHVPTEDVTNSLAITLNSEEREILDDGNRRGRQQTTEGEVTLENIRNATISQMKAKEDGSVP